MHCNYHFFKYLAAELDAELNRLTLLTVFSQEKNEMVLGFGNSEKEFYIKCSVLPTHSGFYFSNLFHRAKKNSIDLWGHLIELEVNKVTVFEGERAFAIYLSNSKTIVFKMFGNRANILVFEGEKATHIFNNALQQDLDLKLQDFPKVRKQTFEAYQDAEAEVFKLFPTWGKLANQLYKNKKSGVLENDWELVESINNQLNAKQFFLVKFNHKLHLSLLPIGDIIKTFNSTIEASNSYFTEISKSSNIEVEKSELSRRLTKSIKLCEQYIDKAEIRLSSLQNTISNQDIGHILMANLYAIPSRAESVELLDFVHNKPIIIKLKKELSAQKNAENYYRKAKKEEIEKEFLKKNIDKRRDELKTLKGNLESLRNESSLKELRKFAQKEDLTTDKKKQKGVDDLFKSFEKDGYQILVGRNSKNNDLLTLKYASKNDLWLHAKDVSGSHVVIKDRPGQKTPAYIIEKAAGLAAWFSKRKSDSLVPVMYTPKKFVRKTKGSPAGQVIVEKEEVVLIEPTDPRTF